MVQIRAENNLRRKRNCTHDPALATQRDRREAAIALIRLFAEFCLPPRSWHAKTKLDEAARRLCYYIQVALIRSRCTVRPKSDEGYGYDQSLLALQSCRAVSCSEHQLETELQDPGISERIEDLAEIGISNIHDRRAQIHAVKEVKVL